METTNEIFRARALENLFLARLRQPRHGAQRQAHVQVLDVRDGQGHRGPPC